MGTQGGKRKVGGKHKHKKYNKQKLRTKFENRHIDQVWEDIRKPPQEVHNDTTGPLGTTAKAELDEDLPGLGKNYCIPCSRYFQTAIALADHEDTKVHKRRVKLLINSERPHNQKDADAAGGMGAPDNGRKLRSDNIAMDV